MGRNEIHGRQKVGVGISDRLERRDGSYHERPAKAPRAVEELYCGQLGKSIADIFHGDGNPLNFDF